jgi:Lrp/AsnC family transcriptional regulator, leucine-responsive regulatory protein
VSNTYDLDETDRTVLRELQANARITLSELSRRVGLTAPAVGERIRRLEEAGVISGYHAVVDLEKIGRTISAFIRVRFSGGGGKYDTFQRLLERSPEVLECYHITGEDCFIVRAAVATISDLERLSSSLARFGDTTTSIVYSTTIQRRIFEPLRNKST